MALTSSSCAARGSLDNIKKNLGPPGSPGVARRMIDVRDSTPPAWKIRLEFRRRAGEEDRTLDMRLGKAPLYH
jgi:hypothetical protein